MKIDINQVDRVVIALAEKNNISLENAKELLSKHQVVLETTERVKSSYHLQVAFLTCYNIANRVFKGGVICNMPEDIPNLLKFEKETFIEVLEGFFPLNKVSQKNAEIPKILFGKHPLAKNEAELVCSNWQGGLNIYNSEIIELKSIGNSISLGACLASAYAIFWAFNRTYFITEDQYKESFGYSLWNNSLELDWHSSNGEGPEKIYLPSKIWSVGLGHLGQAYLWIISLLKSKQDYEILLQDYDKLGIENLGAQILSFESQINKSKARICAEFLEKVGVDSIIMEKKFIESDQQDESLKDFEVLLTGLDNIQSRQKIDTDRFKICLDGATNGKLINFDSFTFRNLTLSQRKPSDIWQENQTSNEILHENLYRMVEEKGGCGILTNVGISTPFVGLFGASILISELIKMMNKGNPIKHFSGKMSTINSYTVS
ncbi:ThiF family adenylyltransferase [Emticicia agri]|uniref:THIF-type NAD/FAD binding fold domain-containing protein n=1 Tax=Emticicia agri TaxID=2492393 RepID=A0A4Q5LXT6_9BACT|nr:ThiF family adenylyltransferase [Emticicia agri]RYU94651.1 hypothetical protein EWM59_16095 [Emticicia agri]